MNRLRHTDELVGVLVVLAVAVLVGAILEAGLLGRWFQPTSTLHILLPDTGGGGLVAGGDIEVLGTHAGKVDRIVINPNGSMRAVADIDDQLRAVIPRNSTAVIRRRFGIAGSAFIDIQRGTGAPMDWSYAVIEATTERPPTDNVSALLDEVREKVFPILTDLGRATHSAAALMEKIERGEGVAGRLMTNDSLMRSAEAAVTDADDAIKSLNRLLGRLDEAAVEVATLVKSAGDGKTGLPSVLRQVDQILADFRPALRDLRTAATRAPAISRNVEETSQDLPALLLQTQTTAQQLEKLLIQLRGHWLLGGGSAAPEPRRLAPTQARP